VKRLTAWLAGFAGGAALYRLFRRQPAPAAPGPDPAEALKAKLAETRSDGGADADAEPVEPDVEARRRSVHEQARATLDEMNDA
jgi:hypothetical protein